MTSPWTTYTSRFVIRTKKRVNVKLLNLTSLAHAVRRFVPFYQVCFNKAFVEKGLGVHCPSTTSALSSTLESASTESCTTSTPSAGHQPSPSHSARMSSPHYTSARPTSPSSLLNMESSPSAPASRP